MSTWLGAWLCLVFAAAVVSRVLQKPSCFFREASPASAPLYSLHLCSSSLVVTLSFSHWSLDSALVAYGRLNPRVFTALTLS